MNGDRLVARWESRSGKHWVEMYNGKLDYYYRAPGAGGSVHAEGAVADAPRSDEEALAMMQARVDSGYFQPDANKTPMRRVK